jgi:DNA-binding transcriptional ArsR family regulator
VSAQPLGDDGHEALAVLLSAECRALRRALRPLAWVALEEVALEAVPEGGRLLARTSARQVAERLGVDPGTAAGALRALREHGLLALEREKGPQGRFGLSVYELQPVAGLSVVRPRAGAPLMAPPPVAGAARAPATRWGPCRRGLPTSGTVGAGTAAAAAAAAPEGSGALRPGATAHRSGHGSPADAAPPRSLHRSGQESFDVGTVSP